MMDNVKAIQMLNEKLVGNSYTYISIGDYWSLFIDHELWLVSHEVSTSEEDGINNILSGITPPVLDGVDSEDIAKAIAVIRHKRQPTSGISLAADGTLELIFDNNRRLAFSSAVDIVDWQWCLNSSGDDPYHDRDFLVACFWTGEVKIKEER